MTFDEYQDAAMKTASPNLDMMYALAKLASEAGEALQLECKSLYHCKDYDVDALMDELGDCMWYIALAAQEVDLSLDAIAAANIDKLRKRHGDGYNAAYYQEAR